MSRAEIGKDLMPLVSIVIPCFNSVASISRAVNSALAQNGVNIEVILIDDGSTDDTWRLISSLCESDHRIIGHRFCKNSGPSAARNKGFDVANGDWVAILDADDAFAPDRLKRLIDAADCYSLDCVFDNLLFYDAHADLISGRSFTTGLYLPHVLKLADLILSESPSSSFRLGYLKPVIRGSFIKARDIRYLEDVRLAEDFALYVEFLLQKGRVGIMDAACYVYTTQVGQVSGLASPYSATKFTPLTRYQLGKYLHEKYSDLCTNGDIALLSDYIRWQAMYVQTYDAWENLKKLRLLKFAKVLIHPNATSYLIRHYMPSIIGRRVRRPFVWFKSKAFGGPTNG